MGMGDEISSIGDRLIRQKSNQVGDFAIQNRNNRRP